MPTADHRPQPASQPPRILVAGLVNVETTVRADGFPLTYEPVRYTFFGVQSAVSGVGYNIARALHALDADVRLLALIGDDPAAQLVRQQLAADGLSAAHVLPRQTATAQSVVISDPSGQRMIFTDLKDAQESSYPAERFDTALHGCAAAVLCNINYTRPLLERARQAGVPIITDVHVISSLDDDYNRDFMAAASVLFQSHERLPVAPAEWARQVIERYHTPIVVVSLGADGALLAERDAASVLHIPAASVRPVVSTIGAGDALLACFVHGYAAGMPPAAALRRATIFAAYKIGEPGGGRGFPSATELDQLCAQHLR